MAAYTSTSTGGSWSNPSTWTTTPPTGGPGNGDTVTIVSTAAVQIDSAAGASSNGIVTLGTSGAAGTVVLTVQGTLQINSGCTLIARGDTVLQNNTLTLASGATYTFDSSAASGTPNYKITMGTASGQNSSKLICNGTSGSRCTVNVAAGSANGIIQTGNSSTAWIGNINAQYTDFSNLGLAGTGGFGSGAMYLVPASTPGEVTFNQCTFTACAQIFMAAMTSGTSALTITKCSNSGNITTDNKTWFLKPAAQSGGAARTITDNNFQDGNAILVFGLNLNGLTFARNIFSGVTLTAITGAFGSIQDNLLIERSLNQANFGLTGDTVTRLHIVSEQLNSTDSTGITSSSLLNATGTLEFDRLIYFTMASYSGDDAIHNGGSSTLVQTLWVHNSLFLPNQAGYSSGDFTAHGSTNQSIQCDHNTFASGEPSNQSNGGLNVFGSGFTPPTGWGAWHRDNLCVAFTQGGIHYLQLRDIGTTHNADVYSATNIDYNANYLPALLNGTVLDNTGLNGVSKTGYDAFWSSGQSSIGAHDVNVVTTSADATNAGPKFIDPTRNHALWDSAYLGNSYSAWVTGHAYSVGDFVTCQTSTFFGNAKVNFRCVKAHTSNSGNATNGDPSTSTTTSMINWELASTYRQRQAVLAGTTYVVNGVTYNAIRAEDEWIRYGFTPQVPALKGAAHDGSDIGAVPVIVPGSIGPMTIYRPPNALYWS